MTILRQSGNVTLFRDGLHYNAQHKVQIKGTGQPIVVYTTHNPEQASRAFDHYVLDPNNPYRGK